MTLSDDLRQEMESYLGFLIDHGLEDAYESQPLNRTLTRVSLRHLRTSA